MAGEVTSQARVRGEGGCSAGRGGPTHVACVIRVWATELHLSWKVLLYAFSWLWIVPLLVISQKGDLACFLLTLLGVNGKRRG